MSSMGAASIGSSPRWTQHPAVQLKSSMAARFVCTCADGQHPLLNKDVDRLYQTRFLCGLFSAVHLATQGVPRLPKPVLIFGMSRTVVRRGLNMKDDRVVGSQT